ncbi:helix-turn-helix transcriptional regulator [Streptomyces sp. NPDC004690]
MFKVDMSVLGLSQDESDVYQYVLRHPGVAGAGDIIGLSVPRARTEKTVARLCALGILEENQEGRLDAVDPEAAIDHLAELRLRELHQEFQDITRSRRLVGVLRADRRERTDRTGEPRGVERLRDAPELRGRIDDLTFFCRREFLSMEPRTVFTAEDAMVAAPLDERLLRRGVRVRRVVRKEMLRHPQARLYLRDLLRQGAEIRVAEGIEVRALVYDDDAVLIASGDMPSDALAVRDGELIAAFRSLLESVWEASDELPADDWSGAGDGLKEIEHRVLDLMCRVTKDEAGARALGVSVRTYRRHVADLLTGLGASNRVQAALIARERGWI